MQENDARAAQSGNAGISSRSGVRISSEAAEFETQYAEALHEAQASSPSSRKILMTAENV